MKINQICRESPRYLIFPSVVGTDSKDRGVIPRGKGRGQHSKAVFDFAIG